jgi:hypothetical protein
MEGICRRAEGTLYILLLLLYLWRTMCVGNMYCCALTKKRLNKSHCILIAMSSVTLPVEDRVKRRVYAEEQRVHCIYCYCYCICGGQCVGVICTVVL